MVLLESADSASDLFDQMMMALFLEWLPVSIVSLLLVSNCSGALWRPEETGHIHVHGEQDAAGVHVETITDQSDWSQSEEYRIRMLLRGASMPGTKRETLINKALPPKAKYANGRNIWQTLSETEGVNRKASLALMDQLQQETAMYSYAQDDQELNREKYGKDEDGRVEYGNQVHSLSCYDNKCGMHLIQAFINSLNRFYRIISQISKIMLL